MKEQPQKPINIEDVSDLPPSNSRPHSVMSDSFAQELRESRYSAISEYIRVCRAWERYADHLEQENTALKKRVAELEKRQEIITQWCKLSVEHMKQYEGDQSEYDGMYQAASDLLDRINGTMPWPDLVMERLSKVK